MTYFEIVWVLVRPALILCAIGAAWDMAWAYIDERRERK